MNREDLRYSETHEWVRIEDTGATDGSKLAIVGITDFAVEQLTDVVYIELPQVGRTFAAGEEFGNVESVKAVSPLYSPVDGEVVEVNSALSDQLDWFKTDPFDKGWIVKLRVAAAPSLKSLMDYAAYQKQCAEEG